MLRQSIKRCRDVAKSQQHPAKSLLAFVCKMNREPIRSSARSLANLEFHHVGDEVNEVARKVVAALEAQGHRATVGGFVVGSERQALPHGSLEQSVRMRRRFLPA